VIDIIEAKKYIEGFLKGKNAKYLVFVAIGLMILIATSSFDGADGKIQAKNSTEQRLEQMLNQIEGISDASVMINWSNNKPEGVIIVAKGTENPAIKKMIHDAAAAALGVKANKIEVFSKKEGDLK
jgi:ATP phosphoribosyltransferase